ncbi:MAG: undecaprenyl-diphosphatase UppP [Candidatus Altimarinota bacterium]
MSFLEAVILGVVQGITEFLPISSSGHLILGASLFNLDVENLKSFDIAVHFGTLLAIFYYFRADYVNLIKALAAWVREKMGNKEEVSGEIKENQRLLLMLILGTIPAVLVGLTLEEAIDAQFRNPTSVAIMLIIVGVIFIIAEMVHKKLPKKELNLKNGLIIGLIQALALIPGVSRSGSTITGGLLLGLERAKAARYSFLLGSVAMVAATAYACLKVLKGDYLLPETGILLAGVVASMISGYLAINFLMKFLKKHTLISFGIYRIIVGGAFLLFIAYI